MEIEPDIFVYKAYSTEIINACRKDRSHFLSLPLGFQASQILKADGRRVSTRGEKNFAEADSQFSYGYVACEEIADAAKLEWEYKASSKLFAQIRNFPSVSKHPDPSGSLTEAIAIFSAGGLLLLGIFIATMLRGNVPRKMLVSLALTCLGITIYCLAQFPYLFSLRPSISLAHRILLAGHWIGMTALFYAYHLEGYLPRWVMRAFFVNVAIGAGFYLFGPTGTFIQIGSTITYPACLLIMFFLVYRCVSYRRNTQTLFNHIVVLLCPILLVVFCLLEMLNLLNVIAIPYVLPAGYVLGVLCFAVHVNEGIASVFRERDFLRANLEKEVESKTLDLTDALAELRSTQAELIQSAKLASLGTLSAGIAHEINNSLNYMNGAINGLSRIASTALPKTHTSDFEELLSICRQGMSFTINIVKSLREHSSTNTVSSGPVLVQDTFDLSLALLGSKKGDVSLNVNVEKSLTVYSTPTGLSQILVNLISNAIDAVEKQKNGCVDVSARRQILENARWVEIVVRDNGPGIPEPILKNIFDPFFTTKDVGKGSGLGLYVTRAEVLKHKGKITCTSGGLENGTVFTVLLPADAEEI